MHVDNDVAHQGLFTTDVQSNHVSFTPLGSGAKAFATTNGRNDRIYTDTLLHCRSRTSFNTAVKYVGAYCVLGYVITEILYLGVWCRPIQQYWAVPVENCRLLHSSDRPPPRLVATADLTCITTAQCASYYHHLITSSVFNISSDLMILCIPLPMLYKLKLSLKRCAPTLTQRPYFLTASVQSQLTRPHRKLILGGVFSLGFFVVSFPLHQLHPKPTNSPPIHHLTPLLLDPRRNPQPLLQLYRALRLSCLPELVRRRIRDLRLRRQHPPLLASLITSLPRRCLQPLPGPIQPRRERAHGPQLERSAE